MIVATQALLTTLSVMTLRTPRRRVSPRTKRRYRAIKNFLRRALGNPSQPDIKINSSIAINVTNLNRKVVHLEEQLNDVSQHLLSVECISRKISDTSIPADKDDIVAFPKQAGEQRKGYTSDTKVLYKTPEYQYRKYDNSDGVMKIDLCSDDNIKMREMSPRNYDFVSEKHRKNKDARRVVGDRYPNLLRHKSKSVYDNLTSAYSTSSYHSLVNPRNYQYMQQLNNSELHSGRKHKKTLGFEKILEHKELKRNDKLENHERNDDPQRGRKQKYRHKSRELDSDYIADIIKRQYRPMKMFGKRESKMSQFSAPICRDQEYKLNDNILQGSAPCSCCYNHARNVVCNHSHDYVNDQRSICDTRLYSSNRHHKHNRKNNNYNDSTLYDLIPVKEKSSPKSRRKFEEDNMLAYQYFKEVPPSPKTLRPKLNLKVQHHTEIDEDTVCNSRRNRKRSHSRIKRRTNNRNHISSTDSFEITEQISSQNAKHIQKTNFQHDTSDISSQAPIFNNKQTSAIQSDNSLNKCLRTNSTDKTDKALCEIKDILQTFLLEIKKESSNSGTSNLSNKSERKYLSDQRQNDTKTAPDAVTNNILNSKINNCMEQRNLPPPYMSPFPTPCCYPILPICPINCIQNGCVLPTQSYTCATCANKEEYVPKNTKTATCNTNNQETEQLIKEIYNFVRQVPKPIPKQEYHDNTVKITNQQSEQKKVTSRSIGGSSVVSRHDAKVGTNKLKCYSKSCEAISSPNTDVSYNRTSPSYSDTILEKLSLQVTGSESEISSATTIENKNKANRFTKILRSFGLLKKKINKNVIEELSEVESTDEVEVKMNPPFKQNITNYVMHGQEYYNYPPVQNQNIHRHGFKYAHNYSPNYSRYPDGLQAPYNNTYSPRESHYGTHPSAPPYPNCLNKHHHMQPQVPLCLKEIEVKSMATQSDKKMSFFQKFTKKLQPDSFNINTPNPPNNSFTQTPQEKLGFWKTLQLKQQLQLEQQQQERLKNKYKNTEPMNFTLKTQKELAQGDIKMRNAMLKKLFYKRNPFSPGNLIVRTILGKDKSSFGEPPKMYRPRMFF